MTAEVPEQAHAQPQISVHGEQLTAAWAENLLALQRSRVAERLADHDAALWGPEAAAEASTRLGWLDVVATSTALVPKVARLRRALLDEGVDRVVLCGMGGSSLAPELLCAAAGVTLIVLDSTHPDQVRSALVDLERTVVVVSSKSGSTLETDSLRRTFIAAFEEAGLSSKERLVVVTDPGSPLAELAEREGCRALFLADPNVGGRYSALTAFGLVPSALAGVDVGVLLGQAQVVLATLGDDDCPGLALGAALGAGATLGADKLALVQDGGPLLGGWIEQLVAESTGKEDTGLLPVVLESGAPELSPAAADLHVIRSWPPAPAEGTLVQGQLGALLVTWEFAVAVAGRLLGINPFNQPDVESAKDAARGLLDDEPELEPAAFVEGDVEVRGTADLLEGVQDLAGAIAALVRSLGPDGYLAVLAFLDRHRDERLLAIRDTLARRCNRPVTFGWGPRYLHSTGQFHKGGKPVGSFLQITGLVADDLEVPGRDFSFGTLIEAQANGDARVLADLGRPVLRLHLRGPQGLDQLMTLMT